MYIIFPKVRIQFSCANLNDESMNSCDVFAHILQGRFTGIDDSYQIHEIARCACAGDAGNVLPATDFKGNR